MNCPASTPFLKGFEKTVQHLQEMVQKNTLPHGLIFSGPKGIGKSTLAYHLARYLLKGSYGDFCISKEDPLFKRVAAKAHGDLMVLEQGFDKTGKMLREIGVEQARQVVQFFSRTSLEGGWRVALIDSIDQMNRQAANALLKILEEPPERCVFILINHQQGKVLPTVASRCWTYNFFPLKEEVVEEILRQKGISDEDQTVKGLAHLSEGSPGQALALYGRGGLAFYQHFMKAIEGLSQNHFSPVLEFVDMALEKEGEEKENTPFLEEFLQTWLAKVISQKARGEMDFSKVHQAKIDAFLALRPLEDWVDVWHRMTQLFREVHTWHLDRRQALLQTLWGFYPEKG